MLRKWEVIFRCDNNNLTARDYMAYSLGDAYEQALVDNSIPNRVDYYITQIKEVRQ